MSGEREQYWKVAPEGYKALLQMHSYLKGCGLDSKLLHLVYLRVSQINRCAFCIDMHARDARKSGETEQRLILVSGWEEALVFSPRERAALAWTDALTRLPQTGAPPEAYDPLKDHFSEKEIVDLTVLIGLINLWNRIGVGFRLQHAV